MEASIATRVRIMTVWSSHALSEHVLTIDEAVHLLTPLIGKDERSHSIAEQCVRTWWASAAAKATSAPDVAATAMQMSQDWADYVDEVSWFEKWRSRFQRVTPLILVSLVAAAGLFATLDNYQTLRRLLALSNWTLTPIAAISLGLALAALPQVRSLFTRALAMLRQLAQPMRAKPFDVGVARAEPAPTGLIDQADLNAWSAWSSEITPRLDAVATALRTAQSGGHFTPRYQTKRHAPAYLVVAERLSSTDHFPERIRRWFDALRQRGVSVDFLEGDPSNATSVQRIARDITRLAQDSTRLLIAGSEEAFIHPASRALTHFGAMIAAARPQAIFLANPAPPPRRRQVLRQALHAESAPATPQGLARYWRSGDLSGSRSDRFLHDERWMSAQPPSAKDWTSLYGALVRHLQYSGFRWLCAIAIYPVTDPALTRRLGRHIHQGDRRAFERDFARLSELPWLRHGYMPEWLRSNLVALLPPDEKAMRARQLRAALTGAGRDDALQTTRVAVPSDGGGRIDQIVAVLLRDHPKQRNDFAISDDLADAIVDQAPSETAFSTPSRRPNRQAVEPYERSSGASHRRHVIYFDQESELNSSSMSNIAILAHSVASTASSDTASIEQFCAYQSSQARSTVRGAICNAYADLAFQYDVGDEIFIFGAGRGAYCANELARMINACGILSRRHLSKLSDAYALYQAAAKAQSEDMTRTLAQFRLLYGKTPRNADGTRRSSSAIPKIQYLGLFDATLPNSFTARRRGFVLPDNVLAARHAVAIDETRVIYPPALWSDLERANEARGAKAKDGRAPLQQRWFVGAHEDVAGGVGSPLSSMALAWIADGATEAGLQFDRSSEERSPLLEVLDQAGRQGVHGPITRRSLPAMLAPEQWSLRPRMIWSEPTPPQMSDAQYLLHPSVLERTARSKRVSPALRPFRSVLRRKDP